MPLTRACEPHHTNLTSVYFCCKAALPYMLEQGKGSLINTASIVAIHGGGHLADLLLRIEGRGPLHEP